jgi:hypothetical protein
MNRASPLGKNRDRDSIATNDPPVGCRYSAFAERDLSNVDYVYLWADGIHVNVRLEEDKLCLLVMIGVRADGRKELVALADG